MEEAILFIEPYGNQDLMNCCLIVKEPVKASENDGIIAGCLPKKVSKLCSLL